MSKRFYGLDLLKFLCAVGIVCHHYYQETGCERFFFAANYGFLVELFFIISGFLAMNSYGKVLTMNFKTYFVRKASRLYPMAILSVALMVFIELIFYRMNGFFWGEWGTQDISYWRIVTNALLVFGGSVVGNVGIEIINPLWYLCVLLFCEILFFIFVKIGKKYKKSVNYFFVLMICIGLMIYTYSGTQSGISSTDLITIYPADKPFFNGNMARGYCSFFEGCLLFELMRILEKRTQWIIAFVDLIIVAIPYCFNMDFLIDGINYTLCLFLFPAIILISVNGKIVNVLSDNAFVRVLGASSFDVYIFHEVVIAGVLMLVDMGVFQLNGGKCAVVVVVLALIWAVIMNLAVEHRLNSVCEMKLMELADNLLER